MENNDENKENIEESFSYDWDNISVGHPELNLSGKFFERRHPMHEKVTIRKGKSKKNGKQEATVPEEAAVDVKEHTPKQNAPDLPPLRRITRSVSKSHKIEIQEDKGDCDGKKSQTGAKAKRETKSMAISSKPTTSSHNKENVELNKTVVLASKEKSTNNKPKSVATKKTPVEVGGKAKQIAAVKSKPKMTIKNGNKAFVMLSSDDTVLVNGPDAKEIKENKRKELRKSKSVNELNKSSKKFVKPALQKTKSLDKPQPSKPQLKRPLIHAESKLHNFADIQKRRMDLAKKYEEEEKKKIKPDFHAKPAPKFKPVPIQIKSKSKPSSTNTSVLGGKSLIKQNSEPNMQKSSPSKTRVPSVLNPERLKRTTEHLKKLIEKYEPLPVKFKAQTCKVLYKQPFVPKHNEVKTFDAKPFQLQLSNRLEKRKEYDRKLHTTIEIRKQTEELRRKQQDEVDIKELRRKMEFKANPIRFVK